MRLLRVRTDRDGREIMSHSRRVSVSASSEVALCEDLKYGLIHSRKVLRHKRDYLEERTR
jgi:hypothetical protein